MKDELYFTQRATENEHFVLEEEIAEFCSENPDVELVYYRKFKTGHIPEYREIKIKGNIGKFLKFAEEKDITIQNYWQQAI